MTSLRKTYHGLVDWISNAIAAVALVVSGYSLWTAKAGPKRQRQALLRDELRGELAAIEEILERTATELREGKALTDVSGDMTSIGKRIAGFDGRIGVPYLSLSVLQAKMSIFSVECGGVQSLNTRIAFSEENVEKMQNASRSNSRLESYLASERTDLQSFERARPAAIIRLQAELATLRRRNNDAIQVLNRADNRS